MAKRLSRRKNTLRRKSSRRKNTLRRKTLRRKSFRRKNMGRKSLRRKNIKKRGGVPVMEGLLTSAKQLVTDRAKQLVTDRAKQLVGHLKNCVNVFHMGEYPHIVGVSFDEENHRMKYNLTITLSWSELVPVPVEQFVGNEPSWKDDDAWRNPPPVSRSKVYNVTKSYSELYSDCDMEGIDFTKSRGKKIKAYLENSFDFMNFKKNKDEECKRRFAAIENAVRFYETEMNNLLKDDTNLPLITKDLSSLGWTELTP